MQKLAAKEKSKPTETQIETTPEVKTMTVQNSDISTNINVQGELVAFEKIDIFSEVPGIVKGSSRPFKIGNYFPKGSVLLTIDAEEARLSLLSQKASLQNAITQMMPDLKIDYPQSFQNWKKYLDEFDVENTLQPFPKPINEQEKFFVASRNILTPYYNIKSGEKRLSKYQVYAPFGGVLTQANTYIGALVQPGQMLGRLMGTNNYELQAVVPLSDLKNINVGDPVILTSRELEGDWKGKVKRISNQIDRGTQSATIFISVGGKNLREGMYLTGSLSGTTVKGTMKIPRNLLVNQNQVYSVNDNLLSLVPVQVLQIEGGEVLVSGLENGTVILSESVPGVFEGMKVKVLN